MINSPSRWLSLLWVDMILRDEPDPSQEPKGRA